LKAFFKESYGMDMSENSAEFSENERNTLRDLKQYLTSEAYENVISKGVFETMTDFKT
uniref:PrkA family serine protein kinase n=1 Tax=Gongylonema pulchrum TaxID=637853 RepID=A0A183EYM3_9BILA